MCLQNYKVKIINISLIWNNHIVQLFWVLNKSMIVQYNYSEF